MLPEQASVTGALEEIAIALGSVLLMFGALIAACLIAIILGALICWAAEKHEEYKGWHWRDVASRAIQHLAWKVIARCIAGDDRRMCDRAVREDEQVAMLEQWWEVA